MKTTSCLFNDAFKSCQKIRLFKSSPNGDRVLFRFLLSSAKRAWHHSMWVVGGDCESACATCLRCASREMGAEGMRVTERGDEEERAFRYTTRGGGKSRSSLS